jgi:hypothetical protein
MKINPRSLQIKRSASGERSARQGIAIITGLIRDHLNAAMVRHGPESSKALDTALLLCELRGLLLSKTTPQAIPLDSAKRGEEPIWNYPKNH